MQLTKIFYRKLILFQQFLSTLYIVHCKKIESFSLLYIQLNKIKAVQQTNTAQKAILRSFSLEFRR